MTRNNPEQFRGPGRCKSAVTLFNAIPMTPIEYPPAGRWKVKITNAIEVPRDNGEPMVRLVLEVPGYRTFLGHLTFDENSKRAVSNFKRSTGVETIATAEGLVSKEAWAELAHADGYCKVVDWIIDQATSEEP